MVAGNDLTDRSRRLAVEEFVRRSAVALTASAPGLRKAGTGVVVAPGYVLTSAHVVTRDDDRRRPGGLPGAGEPAAHPRAAAVVERAELVAAASRWLARPAGKCGPVPERGGGEGRRLPYRVVQRNPQLSAVFVARDAARVEPLPEPGGLRESREEHGGRGLDAVVQDAHLLLAGGPGSGKSTAAREAVGRLAARWRQDGEAPLLPVLVSARRLAAGTGSLPERVRTAAEAELGTGGLPNLDVAPPGATWLVVIDGIDEVLDGAAREELIGLIAGDAATTTATRYLLTTRPLPAQERLALRAGRFVEYMLPPFDGRDLHDFATAWFRAGGSAQPQRQAERYVNEVRAAGLAELCRVPLIATITAVLFDADRSPLPTGRAEAYERFLGYLLSSRGRELQTRAALAGALTHLGPAGDRAAERLFVERRAILERIAVHRIEEPGTSTVRALERETADLHPPGAAFDAYWPGLLIDVFARTGVLVRAGDDLDFVHQTFAEYLWACVRGRESSAADADAVDRILSSGSDGTSRMRPGRRRHRTAAHDRR